MEPIFFFFQTVISEYWDLISMVLIVVLGGIILNEIKQFVDWVKNSRTLLRFLELSLIAFIMLMTYHSLHTPSAEVTNPDFALKPFYMVVLLILSAFVSMALYIILIFLLDLIESQRKRK